MMKDLLPRYLRVCSHRKRVSLYRVGLSPRPESSDQVEQGGDSRKIVHIHQFLYINIYIYLHTRALSRQNSDPCALSALEPFSAISPPLGLVSSRGLRPAIALGREGLAGVRVRPLTAAVAQR